LKQLRESVGQAKRLGMQVDLSVISSWDLGGHWIEPRHASMGLYPTEAAINGGKEVDVSLPFPPVPPAAPKGADGKPAFWRDVAVLAARDARRSPGHDIVFRLDPEGVHNLREAVLDNGNPGTSDLTATMTPAREFSVAVSTTGTREADFHEVIRATLVAKAGPQRFAFKAGTLGRYVRLRLLSGHDGSRPRWTLGEFAALNDRGVNVVAARVADRRRNGALVTRSTAPLGYDQEWNLDNLHDGATEGPRGVFATAGPPPADGGRPAALECASRQMDHPALRLHEHGREIEDSQPGVRRLGDRPPQPRGHARSHGLRARPIANGVWRFALERAKESLPGELRSARTGLVTGFHPGISAPARIRDGSVHSRRLWRDG
jgi:hypothetical protein